MDYKFAEKIDINQKMIISATMYGDNYLQLKQYLSQFKDRENYQDLLHFAVSEALGDDNPADARRVYNIAHELGINMQDHSNVGEILCRIVQQEQVHFLDRVLETGANPDRLNHQAKNPLYYAAIDKKHPKMVESLINAKANIYYSVHHDFCENVFQMVDAYLNRAHQKKTIETARIIDLFKEAATPKKQAEITKHSANKDVLKKRLSKRAIPLKRRRTS